MSIEVHTVEGWDADDIGNISGGRFRLAPDWYENTLSEEQLPDFAAFLKSHGDAEIVHTDHGPHPASWLLAYLDGAKVKAGITTPELIDHLRSMGWLSAR